MIGAGHGKAVVAGGFAGRIEEARPASAKRGPYKKGLKE